eukprot:6172192-Pleurochrysis_carterae.AAC.1
MTTAACHFICDACAHASVGHHILCECGCARAFLRVRACARARACVRACVRARVRACARVRVRACASASVRRRRSSEQQARRAIRSHGECDRAQSASRACPRVCDEMKRKRESEPRISSVPVRD